MECLPINFTCPWYSLYVGLKAGNLPRLYPKHGKCILLFCAKMICGSLKEIEGKPQGLPLSVSDNKLEEFRYKPKEERVAFRNAVLLVPSTSVHQGSSLCQLGLSLDQVSSTPSQQSSESFDPQNQCPLMCFVENTSSWSRSDRSNVSARFL